MVVWMSTDVRQGSEKQREDRKGEVITRTDERGRSRVSVLRLRGNHGEQLGARR